MFHGIKPQCTLFSLPKTSFFYPFIMTFSFSSINNKRNAWWDNEMMRNTVLEFRDMAAVKVGVTDSNNNIKLLCMTF